MNRSPSIAADELTNEQRAALFRLAGVEMECFPTDDVGVIGIRSRYPVAVADRGDGGYIVAVCKPPAPPKEAAE
jgi:hypothetical protein